MAESASWHFDDLADAGELASLDEVSARQLAKGLSVPFVDLCEYRISPGILRRLSAGLAARYRCVPMMDNSRRVVLVFDSAERLASVAVDPGGVVEGLRGAGGEGRELVSDWLAGSDSPRDGERRLEFALTTSRGMDAALERRLLLPE